MTVEGTTMRSRLLAGLGVGVLLLTAGCGDEEEGFSKDEQKAVDAFTATMEGSKPEGYQREQWRCTAEGIVERVGLTRLKQSGLLTEDFESRLNQTRVEADVAGDIGEAYLECYDLEAYLAFAAEEEPRVPEEAWEQYGECFDEHRDKLQASVAEANTEGAGQKAQKVWTRALTKCNKALAAQVG